MQLNVRPIIVEATKSQQLEKIKEEFKELIEAVTNGESDERQGEEAFDLIQTAVTFIGNNLDRPLLYYASKHEKKMESRNHRARESGIKEIGG